MIAARLVGCFHDGACVVMVCGQSSRVAGSAPNSVVCPGGNRQRQLLGFVALVIPACLVASVPVSAILWSAAFTL